MPELAPETTAVLPRREKSWKTRVVVGGEVVLWGKRPRASVMVVIEGLKSGLFVMEVVPWRNVGWYFEYERQVSVCSVQHDKTTVPQ